MGYETILHLIGVTVDPSRRAHVDKLIKKQREAKKSRLAYILGVVDFTSEGYLEFRHKKLPLPEASELPDEEGFVLTAAGKWYDAEAFAEWLCRHDFEGFVVQHSREGDGDAWGWEFRHGRVRYHQLKPAGLWKRIKALRKPKAAKRIR
jgi:hypothetical protein